MKKKRKKLPQGFKKKDGSDSTREKLQNFQELYIYQKTGTLSLIEFRKDVHFLLGERKCKSSSTLLCNINLKQVGSGFPLNVFKKEGSSVFTAKLSGQLPRLFYQLYKVGHSLFQGGNRKNLFKTTSQIDHVQVQFRILHLPVIKSIQQDG